MITILATVFVFGLVVLVHEWGHFITAKLFRMQVDEFAIGFGPALLKKRVGETLYSIRAIPLGGYNKIAGMSPDDEYNERGFNNKPLWQRFIVISAGAIMNFILAVVIYFLVLSISGVATPSTSTYVGELMPKGPASIAHMEKGDKILSINGRPVSQWDDIHRALDGTAEKAIPITVQRGSDTKVLTVIPANEGGGSPKIGIYPRVTKEAVSVPTAIIMAGKQTVFTMKAMIVGLGELISGTQKAEISGPIGIAQLAGQVAQQSFISLLMLTALISINLGIINLLPIPMLDGGLLILLIWEGITGKKISTKAQFIIQLTGLAILAFIFIYATYSDISRLF